MNLRLPYCSRPLARAAWLCLVIAAAALAAIAARFCLHHGFSWRCPSLALLGVPCPGCGSTRALAALAHLELRAALFFNPLLVLSLLLLFAAPVLKLSWEQFDRRGWPLFGIAVLINWIYLLFFLPR